MTDRLRGNDIPAHRNHHSRPRTRHPRPSSGAASWYAGLLIFCLLATLLFLGLHFYLLFVLDGTEATDSFFPIGIPITIWLLISVLHFSLSIVGGLRAGRGRAMGFYGVPLARARPRRPESRIRRTSSRSTGLSASILIDWRAVDMMEILALTLPSSRGSDPTIDREYQEKHKQKPAEHEEDEPTIEH